MKKNTLVMAIVCLLVGILAGCAASESALRTVTEKAKQLQQKVAKSLASEEEPAPTTQKEPAAPPPKKAAAVARKETPSPLGTVNFYV
ncbi:MAG: hypothetical protein PHY29_12315 [Syntrophales bacterium]|nr:hypothetical protein [Syntrophales bacterium]